MLPQENQPGAVEQLIYTWAEAGLNGQPGYGVLAASPGLSDLRSKRYQKLSPYLPYELPSEWYTGQATLEDAPVCLAFLEGDTGRILVHKQYTGTDALGRQGTYVTHLLAGLSPEFGARDAMLLWHAHAPDLWITERTALKPQILKPVAPGYLSELQHQAWNSFSLVNEPPALRRTLALFLQERSPTRVYLCGQTAAIALTIWCITQSFPRQMLKNLTFTTYEDNVAYSREKIVGLSPRQNAPPLPPGFFYVDLATAAPFLSVTITPTMDSYLTFALQQLARRSQSVSGPVDRLTEFLALAQEQAIEQPTALLTLFEQSQARFLQPPEVPAQAPLPQRSAVSFVPSRPVPLSQPTASPPAVLPVRAAFLGISLVLNVLLLLSVASLLLFHGGGNPGVATQTPQQVQGTTAVLHGNDVRLSLVGVSTSPDPTVPGQLLTVSIIIKNQGPAIWTTRQGFYLACVPAGTNGRDADCQAIVHSTQENEPGVSGNPIPLMESIPAPGGLSVSPAGYYVFVFQLMVQPLSKGLKKETHQIIVRIGKGKQLLGGSIKVYFLVCAPGSNCSG
jgi:hypothetical protein